MATLAVLKAKIANDLKRSDVDSQISDAVVNSISYYQRRRLWFLEAVAETTTSASQAYYAVPNDFKAQDTLLVNISGSREPLVFRHYEDIDEMDDGRFYGQPASYALYQNNVRLYPVPDSTYVLRMSYHKSLDAPSESGSNAWTSDLFNLIRYRADWDVANHTLRNPELALIFKQSEAEEKQAVFSENMKRVGTGSIKRSQW